jgi:hypothetical protein
MVQKLKVTFRGEVLGELSAGDVTMDEAQRLEDVAQMTFNEMIAGVDRSSAKATRALVWFLRVRKHGTAELFEQFTFGDVLTELVGDEPDPTQAAGDVEAGQPSSLSVSAVSEPSPSSRTTSASSRGRSAA